jgi:histidinol-phosphate/aromatic aminotransferase/cobyric acid decarboxylase-like protein
MAKKAYHGGAFFNAIGNEFATLEKVKDIISADVLDAWFEPSPKVSSKIKEYLSFSLKTSPPTQCEGLIKVISKVRKVPKSNIIVGGGSSDLMFAFFPRILKEDESVLILDPSYGEYAHIFKYITKSRIVRHQLKKEDDFNINYTELAQQIKSESPNLVVLVNPNSPTGKYWGKQHILTLVKRFPKVLFLIDETYIEYIDKNLSLEKEAVKIQNLAIIKSMSKVYALSGARVGYMVAHIKIIDKVTSFIPPWSVSLVAQIAGVEAIKDPVYYSKKYEETHVLRKSMIAELNKIHSIKIYDSTANFFLIELLDKKFRADHIIQKLRKQNIFLRDCTSMSLQFKNNFIRVAVKNKTTNKIIIDALRRLLA